VAELVVLTPTPDAEALPALGLLAHGVKQIPAQASALVTAPHADVLLLDARRDLAGAKALCGILRSTGSTVPVILIVTEGGFTAITGEWGVDDIVLADCGPAEADARIRLVLDRRADGAGDSTIQAAGITIDEANYSAKVHGRSLDLTYKEFELLRFLASHPAHVFTREQLLSEVWGYDYFGGTRTVDVHVRRLRAKLGDSEKLIGTVRNVGYRFALDDTD
jgi:DNA-binding response OmpR family regulator